LKSKFIELLPKFQGLDGENPHKHLHEFMVICVTTKPSDVSKYEVYMRAFPFTLYDVAREWLYYQPTPIVSWEEM